MKVLVCGGRNYKDRKKLFRVLNILDGNRGNIKLIINGAASGADTFSSLWAKQSGIEYFEYPANWDKYGKSAGAIRNAEMLKYHNIDLVVAFPGGKGTQDMIEKAKKKNIIVLHVV